MHGLVHGMVPGVVHELVRLGLSIGGGLDVVGEEVVDVVSCIWAVVWCGQY